MNPVLAAHDPRPYLDSLAAELDGAAFATRIVGGADRPRLTVTNRAVASLTETISCDGTHFRYSWGDRIAAVRDVQSAAQAIGHVLGAQDRPQ